MPLTASPRRRSFASALALALVASLAACVGSSPVDSESDGESADAICPGHSTLRGVDVSEHQGGVDWSKVKHDGIDFAFARVSDGDDHVDGTFVGNWKGMKAHGIVRGAYQFFRPTQDPIAQADLLLARIHAAGGMKDGDMPPTLDIEVSDGASASTVIAHAKKWLEHVEKSLHVAPMIYTSPGFWSGLGSPGGFSHYPLWVASWGVSCPSLPGGFSSFAMWQYSDDASVSGISGGVDADRFNGSMKDLLALGGGKQAPKGDTTAQEEATLQAFELDDSGSTDVDGDGRADVCTFNGSHIACYLSKGDGFGQKVDGPELDGDDFDKAAGFASIRWADIDGNGKADLCLRKSDGVVCWRSNGQGFGKAIHTGVMADKDGWTDKDNWATFRLADVDGDGKADICARNDKEFKCWLSHGDGFGAGIAGPAWDSDSAFGERASWGTIRMADVNGDGKADVCAKNHEGIVCWLSNGHGFDKRVKGPDLDEDAFMDADNWGTIRFADIDGDGKADVCARKNSGFSCWKSHGDSFGAEIHGPELSSDNGWDDHDNWSTLRLADINGDGKADLCARANSGLQCWLSSGHGFGKRIDVGTLANDAGGDHPDQYRTIRFADVDGDGKQDLCYRKGDGLHCRISRGKDGFKGPFDGPAFSDDNKYDEEERYTAIAITGP